MTLLGRGGVGLPLGDEALRVPRMARGLREEPQPLRILGIHEIDGDVGAAGLLAREEVDEAIEWARKTEGPVVLEFRVEKEDAVYPMVPAGSALHEMIRRPVKSE